MNLNMIYDPYYRTNFDADMPYYYHIEDSSYENLILFNFLLKYLFKNLFSLSEILVCGQLQCIFNGRFISVFHCLNMSIDKNVCDSYSETEFITFNPGEMKNNVCCFCI